MEQHRNSSKHSLGQSWGWGKKHKPENLVKLRLVRELLGGNFFILFIMAGVSQKHVSEEEAGGEHGRKFCSSSNVFYFNLTSTGVSRVLSCWAQQRAFMLHLDVAGAAALCNTVCFICRLGNKSFPNRLYLLSIPCLPSRFDICREALGVGCCLSQQGLLCRVLGQ